jgi:CheY-like chemotaxis protein
MPKRGFLGWVEPPLRILLIEDNHTDVVVIRRTLDGCAEQPDVYHARDGEEALDVLERKGEYMDAPRPDMIISCLNLPKISGLEILAKIKKDPKLQRIPFIVLTYSEREEDILRAYVAGASGFFTKPIDEGEFGATVRMIYSYWNQARKAPE